MDNTAEDGQCRMTDRWDPRSAELSHPQRDSGQLAADLRYRDMP